MFITEIHAKVSKIKIKIKKLTIKKLLLTVHNSTILLTFKTAICLLPIKDPESTCVHVFVFLGSFIGRINMRGVFKEDEALIQVNTIIMAPFYFKSRIAIPVFESGLILCFFSSQ